MKIPLSWKGQSLGHWAAAMMRSDKEPLDLVFLMVLRDLTDVSALSTDFRELHQF